MSNRTSTALLFPWSLASMLLLLFIAIETPEVLNENEWLMMVFILPTAIMENLKAGYSTIRVMFYKLIFTMLTFMLAGVAGGVYVYHQFLQTNLKNCTLPSVNIPYHIALTVGIILIIDVANTFTLLKAVKREFGSFESE
jgi:hypothetical protein